jgi:hypothetical protein
VVSTGLAVQVPLAAGGPAAGEERHFVLKMWRDGFSIDGGELRPYDAPGSRCGVQTYWESGVQNIVQLFEPPGSS